MADIELLIKIPEGLKKDFESEQWTALSCMEMKNALEKAISLPKGHGDLIDKGVYRKEFLNSRDFEPMKILDFQPIIIEADKESGE